MKMDRNLDLPVYFKLSNKNLGFFIVLFWLFALVMSCLPLPFPLPNDYMLSQNVLGRCSQFSKLVHFP